MSRSNILMLALSLAVVADVAANPGDLVAPPRMVSDQVEPSRPGTSAIAVNGVGEGVIVYVAGEAHLQFPAGSLVAELVNADGTPNHPIQWLVATAEEAGGEPQFLRAAMTDAGAIRLVWQARNELGDFDIRGRFVNSLNNVIEPVQTLTDTISGDQVLPSLALDQLNHVVLSWSQQSSNGHRPMARMLNSDGTKFAGEFELSPIESPVPVKTRSSAGGCCGGHVTWLENVDPQTTDLMAANIQFWFASPAVVLFSMNADESQIVGADTDAAGNLRWVAPIGSMLHYGRSDRYLSGTQLNIVGHDLIGAPINSDVEFSVDYAGRAVLAYSTHDSANLTSALRLLHLDSQGQVMVNQDIPVTPPSQAEVTLSDMVTDQDGDITLLWKDAEWLSLPASRIHASRYQGSQDVSLMISTDRVWNLPAGIVSHHMFNLGAWCMPVESPVAPEGVCAATGVSFTLDAGPDLEVVPQDSPDWYCDASTLPSCLIRNVLRPGDSNILGHIELRTPSTLGAYPFTLTVTGQQMDPDLTDNVVSGVIYVGDGTPDNLTFPSVTGVSIASTQTSPAITLSGMNVPGHLRLQGAGGDMISINGGEFVSSLPPDQTVQNGDVIRLQHEASSSFSSQKITSIQVGDAWGHFISMTEPRDDTPDAFSFADVQSVPRGSVQSATMTVRGVNTQSLVSISGGEFSLGPGAPFSADSRYVFAGTTITVRHTAAAGFGAATHTTLTVGGIADTFTSITELVDTTPDAFTFTGQFGLPTNVAVVSAPITVSGINSPSSVSISGGEFSVNGGAFVSTTSVVNAGDSVQVRVRTATTASTVANANLSIGGVVGTFSASTGAVDSTPDAFIFNDVTGARKGKAVTSNMVTTSGINTSVPISITGGNARYSKNGGAFTAAIGSVVAGDQVRLQLIAPSSSNTQVQTTVTIGGITDTWSVTSGTR